MQIARLKAPILLVHGLLGFSQLRLGRWTLFHYFPGIADFLRRAGNQVLEADVSPTGGVAHRANQLRHFLNRHVPHGPVHILAHSMGGLDARYLISRMDMAPRVVSLTTIGTPHRGSPFANWGVRRLRRLLRPFFELFGIPIEGFSDLTTDSCRRFNEECRTCLGCATPRSPGASQPDWLTPEWHLPYQIVAEAEGDNDGLVSLQSAQHGDHCDIWLGDHSTLVNWPNRSQHLRGQWRSRQADYADLINRLATDEGPADLRD